MEADSQPPLPVSPSAKIREEGELSSSTEDEVLPSSSKERLPEVCNPVGAAAPVDTVGENTEKPLSPSSTVDALVIRARSSVKSDFRKSIEKGHMPSRVSTAKWNGAPGANDNLVIRFSDDESGSDNEVKLKKAAEAKGLTSSIDNRRPTPSSNLKVGFSQKGNGDKARFQPKRGPFSRTFIASNTKPNGPKPNYAAKPIVKPGTFIRNHDALGQKVVNQFHKPKQGTCSAIGELQDLRQKIAMLETEKLKSSSNNRETMPGSTQNYDSSNTNFSVQKRARPPPSDYVQPEAMESDKKRMKSDISGHRKEWTTAGLVPQDRNPVSALTKISAPVSNPSGSRSNIRCQLENQLVVNQTTKNVDGASEPLKELGSLGSKFGEGYNIDGSGPDNHNLESLFAMEELHDKELEEAQGHRHHCETEERIALKAYREAQSALVEATSRCNFLYRQRELSAAEFLSSLIGEANVQVQSKFATRMVQVDKTTRVNNDGDRSLQLSLELEDSLEKELGEAQEYRHKREIDERKCLKAYRRTQCALIEASERCSSLYLQRQLLATSANVQLYSRCYKQFPSSRMDHLNSQSGVDLDVIQSSQQVMRAQTNANQVDYDCNLRNTLCALPTVSNPYTDRNNIGATAFSEPNSSTSEPLPHPDRNADDGICSSHSSPYMSADQVEQTFLPYSRPCPLESGCEKRSSSSEAKNGPDNEDTSGPLLADSEQSSLLHEAKLRSELRARLGQRLLAQKLNRDVRNMQHSVERAAENEVGNEKSQAFTIMSPFSQVEITQPSSPKVNPDQDWDVKLSFRSDAFSPGSVLRSTFACIKNLNASFCKLGMLQGKNLVYLSHNTCNAKGSGDSPEKTKSTALEDSQLLVVKDVFSKQYESYSCNLDADPFWPLCMYELRGKCNDEQCRWQHIKVHSNKNINRRGSLSTVRSIHQQFPISIAASRLLQRKMLTAELSGHGKNRWFQANESNRKLSYLQSQGTVTHLEKSMPEVESSLEMAILILNQEVDKFEGTNKALALLSRAIEVDPKSSAIWIIYLLIYYSSKRLNEKDDMFLYAVENNAGSYELWLLYINSRVDLKGRLAAYDNALSALCNQSSGSLSESDASSWILDLFLQMLDCLCMSGQFENAMAKVEELICAASTSDEPHHLLPRLYSFLTLSDKCILWICCVYLGVYRRLPEAVVHRFELEKELLEIYWPAVELTDDEMQKAQQLMKAVEHIVDLCKDVVSLGRFTTLKSLQFFAVNHFRCTIALAGFSTGKTLGEKYIELYPSCWELVLLMARIYSNDFQDLTVLGFEEAHCNWPKEVLGIHRIWNQYAAHALENQRSDIASELLNRWYVSAWKGQHDENQMLTDADSNDPNQYAPTDCPSMADEMFGWLNLGLYRKLQNKHDEAQLAVDRALKIAPPDMYKNCVKDHAAFHLMDMRPQDDSSISNIVNLLNSYLVDPRASLSSRGLSRKFTSNIKKPRVQQLVSKFLTEVSPDCAILNSALEAWCGPSLLPESCNEKKQLVNFVEAVMEIVPTNYRFASHVFRQVDKVFNSKDVSASGLLFWASNLLVNAIFEAAPVAPEFVWVEASTLLNSSTSIQEISEKFHERAVSVHPFSIRLWNAYINLLRGKDNSESIMDRARERGLELDL
uniref:Putative zinc-finger domain-containing protein n=2 Tax=Kalanchoe fedtschenkoi TaxID=63787 RepID=A0A7N0V6L9_KALFE